jgi:1-acyl-sn-glycerol-3-phosphate acyltransferase
MAVKKFQWRFLNFLTSIGVVDLVYALFGVFVIVPGRGINQNLNEARHIIRAGGNIVMYPEGRITIGAIGKFKVGAAVLSRQMNVKVLPISLRLIEVNSFRKTLQINIGKALVLDSAQTDEQNSESLRRVVTNLHDNRIK